MSGQVRLAVKFTVYRIPSATAYCKTLRRHGVARLREILDPPRGFRIRTDPDAHTCSTIFWHVYMHATIYSVGYSSFSKARLWCGSA